MKEDSPCYKPVTVKMSKTWRDTVIKKVVTVYLFLISSHDGGHVEYPQFCPYRIYCKCGETVQKKYKNGGDEEEEKQKQSTKLNINSNRMADVSMGAQNYLKGLIKLTESRKGRETSQ